MTPVWVTPICHPSLAERNLTSLWPQSVTHAEVRTKSQDISRHWNLRPGHCGPKSADLTWVPSPDSSTATSSYLAAPQELQAYSLAIELSKARPAVINSVHEPRGPSQRCPVMPWSYCHLYFTAHPLLSPQVPISSNNRKSPTFHVQPANCTAWTSSKHSSQYIPWAPLIFGD